MLGLVKELAAYEKAPDEVEVSVEEMKNWGFPETLSTFPAPLNTWRVTKNGIRCSTICFS